MKANFKNFSILKHEGFFSFPEVVNFVCVCVCERERERESISTIDCQRQKYSKAPLPKLMLRANKRLARHDM